jgi:anti-anti-sigma regulatory factor
MPDYKHLQLATGQGANGPATLVRLTDSKLIKHEVIFGLRDELLGLVDEGHKRLVLNFAIVESFSTETLNSLIMLDDKLAKAGGKQRLCCIRTLIHSVFEITRLNEKFVIKATEEEALADF